MKINTAGDRGSSESGKNGGFAVWEIIFLVTLGFGLILVFEPFFFSRVVVSNADQTRQVNNAKQIAMACQIYAADHNGIFPNGTYDPVSDKLLPTLSVASTAEGCFQDLLASGKIEVEKVFWSAKHSFQCDRRPPNENGTLEPGENCWDYVVGLNNSSNASLPLLFEASDGGEGRKWTSFANEGSHPWENAVIIAFVDGSASKEQIGSEGRVWKGDGVTDLCVPTPGKDGWPEGARIAPATPIR